MYKLIHIHTDFKFLHDTLRYKDSLIYNEIIFIGEVDDSIIEALEKLQLPYKTFNKTEVDKVIDIISFFDGVVLNGLGKTNVELLNQLSKDVRVFLRLFGYELYGLKRNKFIGRKTLNISRPIRYEDLGLKKYIKKKLKRWLDREFVVDLKKQKKDYQAIDAILLYNAFEKEELERYFYLPSYIKLPFWAQKDLELYNKSNEIIIGNSGHAWNNHIEILSMLKRIKKRKDVSFRFFFSYGNTNRYAKRIKEEGMKIPTVSFIEDFLPKDEFKHIYQNASALVINSYRQHALGNIFTAIGYGCKIYLNPRSSTYKWLISEGFYISRVSELKRDVERNNYRLIEEEMRENIEAYQKMQQNYTQQDFLEEIKKFIEA